MWHGEGEFGGTGGDKVTWSGVKCDSVLWLWSWEAPATCVQCGLKLSLKHLVASCKFAFTFSPANSLPYDFWKALILLVELSALLAMGSIAVSAAGSSDRFSLSSEGMLSVCTAHKSSYLQMWLIWFPFSDHPACSCVIKTSPRWLRGFPIRTSQMCQGCTCSKRSWGGKRLHPPARAKWPCRLPIQCPGSWMVCYLFKAAIVLCLGLVNLLWFKTVEPAVCNLM